MSAEGELIQAAQNGDVKAINTLGDIFANEMEMLNAIEWYDRSASLGDHYGRFMALQVHNIVAMSLEASSLYSDALEHWDSSYQLMHAILEDDSSSEEHQNTALESYARILCGIGSNLYFRKRVAEAVGPLEAAAEEGHVMAKVLLGVYYSTDAVSGETGSAFNAYIRKAVPLLELVLSPDFTYSEDSELDQRVVTSAHLRLAGIIRTGVGGRIPSVEDAYKCLLHLQAQNFEKSRDFVSAELSKYRKGFLGGYKYIG